MAAVEIQHGYKYYGSKSKPNIILNDLTMRVQPGTIYGLLGASGCGKTTLLSCIVGVRQLNGGDIKVFGQNPGSPGMAARIGYMPQDIALVFAMTVKESIFYFGRIYGMSPERIEDKFLALKQLLELPPSSQLVKNCSGGQQRRVSFACALIHDPELLILDEPTVGLDPMLRERIWDFLTTNTRQNNTAVIITTHYIEEARQANVVGLMRNGVLLLEDKPDNIMQNFESLEEAFLVLSQKQHDSGSTSLPQLTNTQQEQSSQRPELGESLQINSKQQSKVNSPTSNFAIFKALLLKNFILMSRHPTMVFFLILMPFVSLGSFYAAIGTQIKHQKLGVVNMESTCDNPNMTSIVALEDTCEFYNISCQFVETLGSTDFLQPIVYDTLDHAIHDAKKASIMGYIHIPKNFSKSLQVRIEDGRFADNDTVDQTIMDTHLDMGAGQSTYTTELKILKHFKHFMQQVFRDCNIPTKLAAIPIVFQDPIYGTDETDYQQFMTPGIVLTVVFFLNTLVTSSTFIEERLAGVWDRTLIAGATANQLLWSHFCSQFVLTTIQNIECFVYIGLVFGDNIKGSNFALIALIFLVSVGGMLYGLLLSVYCKTHANSSYTCTGTFYIMVIMCGLMWPLEGMPTILQRIVVCTPFTLPTLSARNIVEKGWEITHNGVYKGYLTIVAWIVIFYLLCFIGIRRKM